MGEQPPVQQAGPALEAHQAALRLLQYDGVRAAHRVHTEDTHLQTRLGREGLVNIAS